MTSPTFPNETANYRKARNELLDAEAALRNRLEAVVDLFWPPWNVRDFSPEGRGAKWYPALSYDG